MKDVREIAKRERQGMLEAKQCPMCQRWFTRKASSRVICFYCEETDGQSPGNTFRGVGRG